MNIEVFENFGKDEGYRIELRLYEIREGLSRVLIDKLHQPEVWGFDENSIQHNGTLISVDKNIVVLAAAGG